MKTHLLQLNTLIVFPNYCDSCKHCTCVTVGDGDPTEHSYFALSSLLLSQQTACFILKVILCGCPQVLNMLVKRSAWWPCYLDISAAIQIVPSNCSNPLWMGEESFLNIEGSGISVNDTDTKMTWVAPKVMPFIYFHGNCNRFK